MSPDPRGVLDDLADRRRRCTAAIATLASFYGLDPAPWLDETNVPDRESDRPVRESKPARRGTKRAKGATARPTEAPTEIQGRILAALQAAGEPERPGVLAKKLKVTAANLRYHLKPLIASGQVEATGKTANRLLSAA